MPTLVRVSGSNLIGLKPTHLPDEVIKSNQASERASLLQSLSAFFPDQAEKKASPTETTAPESTGTDWATKAANSSPLPPRKPGMRHPGVEKLRRHEDKRTGEQKNKRGGQRGGNKKHHQQQGHVQQQQQVQHVEPKPEKSPTLAQTAPLSSSNPTPASVQKSVKKLTLADTKPKKGEVSTIKLRSDI